MKKNTKLWLFLSLFVLIGFPVIFLVVSLLTGDWNWLITSLPASLAAGFMGVWIANRELREERKSD